MNEKSTVLIVDDDEANILLMEYILGKEKYNTISCNNADKALKIVNEKQIDIILSDVMMPGTDGFEFTKEIRKNPKTRLIPIVLLTGLEEVQFRIQGIEAGCDDFITKPSIDCVNKPYYKEEVLTRVKMLLQMNFYRLQINEKEKFELLLNGIGDGYLLVDKNGFIEKSNIKAREWLLLSENLEKTSFKDQIGKYFNLEDEENIFDTIPFYNMSFEMERPKTSQYNQLILECRSFPYRENYELENLLILIHDITDQKKEFRSKTVFFNSLTKIMNNQLDMIKKSLEKLDDPKIKTGLDKSLELELKIHQLSKYTNNIDNTSFMNSEITDFQEFTKEVVSSCETIFKSSGISLKVNSPLQLDPIKIRKDLVSIVFIELILLSISRQTKKDQEINLTIENKNNWLKFTFENSAHKVIESINNDSITIIKHIASLLSGKIEMDILVESGSIFILQIPTSLSQQNLYSQQLNKINQSS